MDVAAPVSAWSPGQAGPVQSRYSQHGPGSGPEGTLGRCANQPTRFLFDPCRPTASATTGHDPWRSPSAKCFPGTARIGADRERFQRAPSHAACRSSILLETPGLLRNAAIRPAGKFAGIACFHARAAIVPACVAHSPLRFLGCPGRLRPKSILSQLVHSAITGFLRLQQAHL